MNSIASASIDIAASLVHAMRTLATAPTVPGTDSTRTAARGADGGTTASTYAAATDKTAALVALIRRVLQQTGNAGQGDSAQGDARPATASAAIILTELLNPTNGAAPMELNLNQLLSNALAQQATAEGSAPALSGQASLLQTLSQQVLTQKALAQLPAELLARPQVIEAVVLQNTLLPAAATAREQAQLPQLIIPAPANPNAATPAQGTTTLYRVNVEWQNRLIQLLSPQPLPTGARVPLQVDVEGGPNPRATITLLRPEVAAKILLAQNTAPATVRAQTPTAASTPAQAIQQSLRELLPRQQALHTLVPQLQKFIAPGVREQLPRPVFKALAQLLQALPKPAQLRTAESVRQALGNSGSFLEAKLAQAVAATPGAQPAPQIAAADLKAQIGALLALLRQLAPPTATAARAPDAQTRQLPADDEFIYTKPAIQHAPGDAARPGANDSLDAHLAQLGKLLQAGLARIQLNQLDSAGARHLNHDTQAPVPTWVLELPLRTPHGVDQLQLRIEQRRKQQQQRQRVQWNVEIAFDLHAAGKLAASLAIVDKSVSATLWAERETTHRRVREEMSLLRAGLESVGVNVTEMQCRLGLPPPRANPVSQQLVDVHT